MVQENKVPHLAAGFLGGMTSATALQPLDLLKTRLQQDHTKQSIWHIVKQMPSIKSLWVGTLPSVIRTSVGSSLYLTLLNVSRGYLTKITILKPDHVTESKSSKLPKLSMAGNLISGAATRSAVGIAMMPITVIKTRYESSKYNYASIKEAFRDIYFENNKSLRGFFLGTGSTIVRDAPYAGLYVLLYEQMKLHMPKMLKPLPNKDNISIIVNSSSAMTAAATATIITTPFDTIKTRIQVSPQKYKNFIVASGKIVKNEGFKSLFNGAGLRLVRKTLSAGIAWGIYEELLKYL